METFNEYKFDEFVVNFERTPNAAKVEHESEEEKEEGGDAHDALDEVSFLFHVCIDQKEINAFFEGISTGR